MHLKYEGYRYSAIIQINSNKNHFRLVKIQKNEIVKYDGIELHVIKVEDPKEKWN
jgi:hypothetical protein